MKLKLSWFWIFVSALQVIAFVISVIMAVRAGLPYWVPAVFLLNFFLVYSKSFSHSRGETKDAPTERK